MIIVRMYIVQFWGYNWDRKSGGDSKEEPPVPMPNTEVKLLNADDTWWVTARESRKLPELKKTQSICFEPFLGVPSMALN